MPGTKEGGKKVARIVKKKYGPNYYARIGAKGGASGNTGGFYTNPELARAAGKVGGMRSRRGKPPIPLRDLDDKEFSKAYKHLLAIQAKANKARQTNVEVPRAHETRKADTLRV